jgi:histidinol dehydrogenase
MPIFLSFDDPTFVQRFEDILNSDRNDNLDVNRVVIDILADVKTRGDEAILELTHRFDKIELDREKLRFTKNEIEEISSTISLDERKALDLAANRIRVYHEKQKPEDVSWVDEIGVELGWRWTPLDSVGIYVPGGLASYPSSVLMNSIPAQVAGVKRIAMVVPTPNGKINPTVLYAAKVSGVDEIYRIGGAQAIAALAYGTQTIVPVDKITGPGNSYVAAAKRQVFGKVGIDMIAGPSEVLIIADEDNDPEWIALDLLSQAEHDERAQSILITTSQKLANLVEKEIEKILLILGRRDIAGPSWNNFGTIITVPSLEVAADLSNKIAPEHLELCVAKPKELLKKISNAGAVFMGYWTPEAVGDYIGGSNHVLPTARSARFSSGLSVMDFIKRTTTTFVSQEALRAIGPSIETLAACEGLEAHGLSVTSRLKKLNR